MVTSAPTVPTARHPTAFGKFFDKAGMLLVLALLFSGCVIAGEVAKHLPADRFPALHGMENFLSWTNMKGIALAVSMTGMVACTMLFCLAAGDFDLSIGSMIACAGIIAAVVMNKFGVTAGIAAALGFGALVGAFNGFIVAVVQINALITTLATMQIVRGIGFWVSDGNSVGIVRDDFYALGTSSVAGVPTPVLITIGCFLAFGFLLNRTVFGRDTLAVGGNREAAHLAGISVARVKIIVFTMQGMMAAFAGVVLASRVTSGQPKTSEGFELEVISACVLGGVSLTGGVGSMGFVVAGVLIMGIVQNAMNLMHVDPLRQYVVRGAILLAAVLFDRWKQRKHAS